jgi:hypothetical protein
VRQMKPPMSLFRGKTMLRVVVQFMFFNLTSNYGSTFFFKFERIIGFGVRILIFLIQPLVQFKTESFTFLKLPIPISTEDK